MSVSHLVNGACRAGSWTASKLREHKQCDAAVIHMWCCNNLWTALHWYPICCDWLVFLLFLDKFFTFQEVTRSANIMLCHPESYHLSAKLQTVQVCTNLTHLSELAFKMSFLCHLSYISMYSYICHSLEAPAKFLPSSVKRESCFS